MLRVEDLSAGYNAKPAIQGITFNLLPGRLMGLLGPNGSGKSTLLRAISGVLKPTQGSAWADDSRLTGADAREVAKRVAVVPQGSRLPPGFTAQEIVLMGRAPYLGWSGHASTADEAVAHSALEQAGALEFSNRFADRLSAGEQQRVILARALAQTTPILLLDEPTTHLDLFYQLETLQAVRRLASEHGLAVLMALHDLNLAARFCDDLLVLQNGKVVACGEARQVLTESLIRAVFQVEVELVRPRSNKLTLLKPG